MQVTDNLRIKELKPLISPHLLMDKIPVTDRAKKIVHEARQNISAIMSGQDDRLVVVVGPCSIHDSQAALEYATKLKKYADKLSDELCIVMRVYFEKPRTTVGWKGLINDPNLNGSFHINAGLHIARQLLLEINEVGLPTGSEFLDTIIPQYISDLISWSAIGARTSESQIHRELASGLSMPIGFKNGTTGDVKIAIDGVYAAKHPHHFLGVTKEGLAAIVSTAGNTDCHVILRGSNLGPNYDKQSINHTIAELMNKKLYPYLMIDCSHGNSNKNYRNQSKVAAYLCGQIAAGNTNITGVMIESNLIEGKQHLIHPKQLIYGQSITDACIGWDNTVKILNQFSKAIKQRREK